MLKKEDFLNKQKIGKYFAIIQWDELGCLSDQLKEIKEKDFDGYEFVNVEHKYQGIFPYIKSKLKL